MCLKAYIHKLFEEFIFVENDKIKSAKPSFSELTSEPDLVYWLKEYVARNEGFNEN